MAPNCVADEYGVRCAVAPLELGVWARAGGRVLACDESMIPAVLPSPTTSEVVTCYCMYYAHLHVLCARHTCYRLRRAAHPHGVTHTGRMRGRSKHACQPHGELTVLTKPKILTVAFTWLRVEPPENEEPPENVRRRYVMSGATYQRLADAVKPTNPIV